MEYERQCRGGALTYTHARDSYPHAAAEGSQIIVGRKQNGDEVTEQSCPTFLTR
jgi:hypothetical protein